MPTHRATHTHHPFDLGGGHRKAHMPMPPATHPKERDVAAAFPSIGGQAG